MQLTQAILPVAGLGTRFLPWTKSVPKELLPIGNKPIIALLVDECLDAGITDICFVISKGKEGIAEFFRQDAALEAQLQKRGKNHLLEELQRYDSANFHVVYQDELHGDGHAILQAKDWINADQVAVLFGDDLIIGKQSGLQQLQSNYKDGAMICLEDVPKEKVSSYGIADVEESSDCLKVIKGLVEKPAPEDAPSTLGIVGRYILPKEIFEVLPSIGSSSGKEIRIIDALIAKLGQLPVYGYVFEGTRYDTGTPEGYRKAVQELG
jgi:UTP--glucose-1-phosphate uridylyltransferase